MPDPLIDRYGRRIEYLRLSVTDRCDLRCSYCLPEVYRDFHEPEEWLTFDEIVRVVRIFAELGTRRIRITGGEPLVRHNLPELAERLAALPGVNDLSLSTNGTRLSTLAPQLFAAGVTRLNVSLDSLDPARYQEITKGKLSKVLAGLAEARRVGFSPIKINTVVMRGVNAEEIDALVHYCIEQEFTLRLIEVMPMGDTGQTHGREFQDLQLLQKELEKRYEFIPDIMPGGGPARYLRLVGTAFRIGFITPISQHFCASCNRVRLSVDGTLYLCLGQEHSVALRPLLRAGIDDDELATHIRAAIELKPERHEFLEKPGQIVRFMSMTGG